MNKAIWYFLCLSLCPVLLAGEHVFQIPHLPAAGWNTTITVYNEGSQTATVGFRQWDDSGALQAQASQDIPAHGQFVLAAPAVNPAGIAELTANADKVRVKLAYQYGDSRSVCEFFIPPDCSGTQWFLPNAFNAQFSWFGIAVANHGATPANVTLTAFKDGVVKKESSFTLEPYHKRVGLSPDLWGLGYNELDAVLIRSDQQICAPLSIAGDTAQSRHVFFRADPVNAQSGEKRFYIPHLAGDPWQSSVTVYNLGETAGSFVIHQYDDTGSEVVAQPMSVAARSAAVLSTAPGGGLAGSGTAFITGKGALSVKLKYRFQDSASVCEFFAGSDICNQWLLPNPMRNWFDWFGLVIQNPTGSDITVALTAWKNGTAVAADDMIIGAFHKYVALSDSIWNLRADAFDLVTINSKAAVPMPLSITGDNIQDRHVFFGAQSLTEVKKPKKWTFLFYDDADFYNAYNPAGNFSGEAYSGPNQDVLILEDTSNFPAFYLYVRGDYEMSQIGSLTELNMGDPQTLYNFLMSAKTRYPAERYILTLYDHGGGWRGACWDDTSNGDNLSMDDMQQALRKAGGVDIIAFTAPCLMGELESAYELRDCTDIYIGSENTSGYGYWFKSIKAICDMFSTTSDITNDELAQAIITSIKNNLAANCAQFGNDCLANITMSAVKTSATAELAADLDALSGEFLANLSEVKPRIDSIASTVQNYYEYYSIDLYDFLEKYLALETRPETIQLIQKVQSSLNACILNEIHGSGNPGSHGLTIYFPLDPKHPYISSYHNSAYGLDFSADTHWDEFLRAFFGITAGAAKTSPNLKIRIPDTDGLYPRPRF